MAKILIGNLDSLEGRVTVEHPDGSSEVLKPDALLYLHDVITADDQSQASIRLIDGTLVDISAGQTLVLDTDLLAAGGIDTLGVDTDAAAVASAIGVVTRVEGDVQVLRDGKVIDLEVGDFIFSGDVLKTAANGAATTTMLDGSSMDFGPDFQATLDDDLFASNYADFLGAGLDDPAAIQAAILAGRDPSKDAPAPAAGERTENEGHTHILITPSDRAVTPESGHDTHGQTLPFQRADEELLQEADFEPSVRVTDGVVDEAALATGSNAISTAETTSGTFSIDTGNDKLDTLEVQDSTGTWIDVTNGGTVQGANGVLMVTESNGAYSWIYTLSDNLLSHTDTSLLDGDSDRGIADQVPGESLLVRVTDDDGDVSLTDTLDITVNDDGPVAVIDSAAVAENTPVTIDAFANDTFGADGVDIDNSPAVVVSYTQPAQGTVSYDPNTGLFTYTPAAGAGSVSTADSFNYTLVDGDGDSSSATVSLTLAPDSEPTVSVTDGTVDEKGLPTGSGEQADGDRTNNSDASETTTGSFTINTGNDSLGALEVQDNTGTWIDVTAGGTVQGVNGVLTVTNTAGVYTWSYTLSGSLLTHTDTTAVGSADQQPGEALLVRVVDNEGDISATDTLDITVNDDGPSAFEPTPAILVNSGDGAGSGPLDMYDKMGADDLGNVVFTGGSDGDLLMGYFNGNTTIEPVLYQDENIVLTGYGTDTLTGTSEDTNTVILKIELNPDTTDAAQDQYTITFFTELNDGSGFVFDDFSTAPAGQNMWIGLDKDGLDINDPSDPTPDSADLLITAYNNGTIGTVNTSATDVGVDNQWIADDQGIRMDFVTDIRRNDAMNLDEHDAQGFLYDSHYSGNNFNFKVLQVQGGTTAAIRIRAFDFTGTEGDTDVTNSLNNTVVAIIAGSVTVNGISTAYLSDISVTVDGDSIVIDGLSMGDNVAFEAVSDFESVELGNANGDPDGQGSTFIGDSFAVGALGFDNVIEGDEIALSFDMLATDADGDTSNGALDVTISPEGHVALGTDLDEVLIGDSGVDFLVGGGGDDILIGNNGNDTMTGGSGADVFIWSEGQSGTDVVTDFNIGEGDVLDIADLLVGESNPTAAELDAYMSIASGADTTITIFGDQGNADQIIQLNGFDTTGMSGVQIIESLLSNGNLVTD